MNYKQLLAFIQKTGIENIVWATDLDGTMFEFQDRPEDVTAKPSLIRSFKTLNRLTNGHFYVISGRDMDFIDSCLSPFEANISAEHHCMTRWAGENVKNLVEKPDWSRIDGEFKAATAISPEIWVEKGKIFSRTIHYRNVDTQNAPEIEISLAKAANTIANLYNDAVGKPHLGIKFGSKAIEIGPHAQDKGEAIDLIMSRPGNEAKIPVYWGDSDADRPAGEKARSYNGIYVGVGPHEGLKDISDLHFKTPAQARGAIARLCRDIQKNYEPGLKTCDI